MRLLQEELIEYTDPRLYAIYNDRGLMAFHCVAATPVPLPETYYAWFHRDIEASRQTELIPFIRSTLDEVRLLKAEQYAKTVLRISDHEDAAVFREHVLHRETNQTMDYKWQRDHSGHTLSNYLLGWYVFSHSSALEAEMRTHVRRRYTLNYGHPPDGSVCHEFGSVWTFVSLLHDVGYAFEGALTKGQGPAPPTAVQGMAQHVTHFFCEIFDMAGVPAMAAYRTELARTCGRPPLQVRVGTLGEISDSLRDLGDLSALWDAVFRERPDSKTWKTPPGDAFALWGSHYRQFGQLVMADRMVDLEAAYRYQYESGILSDPIRMLDHGVVGALLLLQHSTTYFQLVMALMAANPSPSVELLKHFGLIPVDKAVPYEAHHWWAGIVWATAAVAIHNVQQSDPWPGCSHATRRQLKLEDDPLAFLGVLVDILQEWDRPKSSRGEFFKGKTPVSSGDCRLGTSRGKILVSYGSARVAEDVMKNLDKALDGWREVVALR